MESGGIWTTIPAWDRHPASWARFSDEARIWKITGTSISSYTRPRADTEYSFVFVHSFGYGS